MAKDPAFLMYSQDFLTGTYTMTDEQVGKYIRLLCLQHQKGRLYSKDLEKICGKYDREIYSKFAKDIDESGEIYYFNARLKEEALKRSKFCESRRTNRIKGVNISSTQEKHTSEHTEDLIKREDIINKIKSIFESSPDVSDLVSTWIDFLRFKEEQFKFRYKSDKSEILSIKNLKNLSHGKTDIAINILNQSIANGWKGIFPIKTGDGTSGGGKTTNAERYSARVEYANRHNS